MKDAPEDRDAEEIERDRESVGRLFAAIGSPQTDEEKRRERASISRVLARVAASDTVSAREPSGSSSESEQAEDEEAVEALQFTLHAQRLGPAVGVAVSYPSTASVAAAEFSGRGELALCARDSLLENFSRDNPGLGRARLDGKVVTICRDHVANRYGAAAVFGSGPRAEARAKMIVGLLQLVFERIEERKLKLANEDVSRVSADVLHFDQRAQRLCDDISRRDAFDLVAFQSIEEELVETVAATGLGRELIGRARHPLPAAPELRDIQADVVLERMADVLGSDDPRYDHSIQRNTTPLKSRLFFPVLAVADALGRIQVGKQGLCKWKRTPCAIPTVLARYRPEVPPGYDLKVVGTIEVSCRAAGRFDSEEVVLDILNFVQDRAADLFLVSTSHLLDRVTQHAMMLAGTGSATLHLLRKTLGAPGEQSFSYYHPVGLAASMEGRGKDALGGINDPPRVKGMGRDSLVAGLPISKGGKVLQEANPKIWLEGVKGMAVFPLVLEHPNAAPAASRRDGLIYVHHTAAETMSRRAIENVHAFSTVAASSISRVFDDLENRTLSRQADAIDRWRGTVLTKGALDPAMLAEAALNITAADVVILQRRREFPKRVDFPVIKTGRLLDGERFRQDQADFEHSCRPLMLLREPFYADVATGDERLGGRIGDFVSRERIQSVACVPLQEATGRPLGVLFICYRSRDVFAQVAHPTRSSGAFLVFSRIARTVIELVANGMSLALGNTTPTQLEEWAEQGRRVRSSMESRPAPDAEVWN
jgi:hypothetical protein